MIGAMLLTHVRTTIFVLPVSPMLQPFHHCRCASRGETSTGCSPYNSTTHDYFSALPFHDSHVTPVSKTGPSLDTLTNFS